MPRAYGHGRVAGLKVCPSNLEIDEGLPGSLVLGVKDAFGEWSQLSDLNRRPTVYKTLTEHRVSFLICAYHCKSVAFGDTKIRRWRRYARRSEGFVLEKNHKEVTGFPIEMRIQISSIGESFACSKGLRRVQAGPGKRLWVCFMEKEVF